MLKQLPLENIVKQIANVIAPDSLAFSDDYGKKYTIYEFQFSEELKNLIEPGDIVITKTPSPLHSFSRRLTKIKYDHVAAFLSKNDALHVSPPRVRVISSNQFLMEKLNPIILRPRFGTEREKEEFLQRLINQKDEKYDFASIIKIFQQRVFYRFNKKIGGQDLVQRNLKKRNICTDLIAYCLAISSVEFMDCLQRNQNSLYMDQSGSLTPDDLIFLSQTEDYFTQIYPKKKLPGEQDQYTPPDNKVAQADLERERVGQQLQLIIRQQSPLSSNSAGERRSSKQRIEEIRKQEKIHSKPKIIITDQIKYERERISTMQSIVDRILQIAQDQNLLSRSFISIIRLYNIDIYIQLVQIVYNIWQLKSISNSKKNDFKKFKEYIAILLKISIETNSVLQYYNMEGTLKRVLGVPKL